MQTDHLECQPSPRIIGGSSHEVNPRADFSNVLTQVQMGEQFQILFGRSKKPVALLSPLGTGTKKKRVLGTYEGKASFSEQGDGKISLEEFLGEPEAAV